MASERADAVVVGAGLLGLAAARELARRGRSALVVEQATVGHERAGSKGTARIFRLGYDDPFYVELARYARERWSRLEDDSGRRLLQVTGQLTFGAGLGRLATAMRDAGAPVERWSREEAAERFPFLGVDGPVLFEPMSGVIAADAVLDVLRGSEGVEVRERTRVTAVRDDGRRVHLSTDSGDIVAGIAVVCAGPWTARLVPVRRSGGADGASSGAAPSFVPTLEQVVYLSPAVAASRVPVFIERRRPWVYGLPVPDGDVVKLALHGGGPVVSADVADLVPDAARCATLADAAARLLPGSSVVDTERCLYDNTPDGDFVVDRVGRVVVGAGTSGHGFKFGPVLGELLAELAVGGMPSWDLGRFRIDRPALAGPPTSVQR